MALNLLLGMSIVFIVFLYYLASLYAKGEDVASSGIWVSLITLACIGASVWIGTKPIWVILSPQGVAYKGLFRSKQLFLWEDVRDVAIFSEGDELTPYLCLSRNEQNNWENETVASMYASQEIILMKYSEDAAKTIGEFYGGIVRKVLR